MPVFLYQLKKIAAIAKVFMVAVVILSAFFTPKGIGKSIVLTFEFENIDRDWPTLKVKIGKDTAVIEAERDDKNLWSIDFANPSISKSFEIKKLIDIDGLSLGVEFDVKAGWGKDPDSFGDWKFNISGTISIVLSANILEFASGGLISSEKASISQSFELFQVISRKPYLRLFPSVVQY